MLIAEKFQKARQELSAGMIEREQEIDLMLTAMVAGEHVLLVGPPGTGKSMLSDAMVAWLHGRKFSILLTKFSTPEEVFGPISVTGLKEDRYRRVTTGKLPEADIAFIDEIFKASSAILNTTLRILNERTFVNDDVVLKCPLRLCLACSNEWAQDQEGGKELGALFDRFLFRKEVRPIGSDRGRDRLLFDDTVGVKFTTSLSTAELDQAYAEATALPWLPESKKAMADILGKLRTEGVMPGDRRQRKSVMAARAAAWIAGAPAVEPDHLEILSHTLWDDPAEQPKIVMQVVGEIANPSGLKINQMLMEAQEILSKVSMKDMAAVAVAIKKLAELHKGLSAISGSKADAAKAFVAAEVARIKKASIEAL